MEDTVKPEETEMEEAPRGEEMSLREGCLEEKGYGEG